MTAISPYTTVIIPVWDDYVKYLSNYVHMLLAEELTLNIIVINNASIVKLPGLPKHVKVVNLSKRVSVGEARNIGLGLTKTAFISFHDVDDIIVPGTLEKLENQLHSNKNIVLTTANTYKENEEGERWPRTLPFGSFWLGRYPSLFALQQLNFNIVMTNGATVIRTEIAKGTDGFGEVNYGEDWLFSTIVCLRGPVKINRWYGLIWRQYSDSLWHRQHNFEMLSDIRSQLRKRVLADTQTPRFVRLCMPLIKLRHAR